MGLKAATYRGIESLVLAITVLTNFSSYQLIRYTWYRIRPAPRVADAARAVHVRRRWTTDRLRPNHWRQPELSDNLLEAAFLNLRKNLIFPDAWNGVEVPRLWTYKLHYFDDLRSSASPAHKRRVGALLDRWISENSPSSGPGWEPYPLSIRLANVVQWLMAEPGERNERRLESVAMQARYLEKSVEHHVAGNHLWANAKALIAAGVLLVGPHADRWLSKGTALLQSCIRSQLFRDGAHAELSPMYQALLIEDLLDVLDITLAAGSAIDPATVEEFEQAIERMEDWLDFMCHPDGRIAFFNDANFDIAPPPQMLYRRIRDHGLGGGRSNERANGEVSGGFTRLHQGEWFLLADTARAGMRRTPGHIHADSLSFELSLGRERVIVNRGISTYEPGNRRLLERSTRSHSTVEVDGWNSTQVTRSFRTGRTARIRHHRLVARGGRLEAEASHDGFCLAGIGPRHSRTWRLSDRGLMVADEISGGGDHRCRLRLHLAPGLECILWSDGLGRFQTPAGRIVTIGVSSSESRLRRSYYHPAFHTTIRSQCIEAFFNDSHEVQVSIDAE